MFGKKLGIFAGDERAVNQSKVCNVGTGADETKERSSEGGRVRLLAEEKEEANCS